MKTLASTILTILFGLTFPQAHGATTSPELLSDAMRPSQSGSGNSFGPTFSADGRFVTFVSQAQDLVTNGVPSRFLNVFVRDLESGVTSLVSVNTSGVGGGNEDSNFPTISSNGQFIAFESRASNLVPGDTNNAMDVFLRDLVSGTTSLVSVNTNGTTSPRGSRYPILSANGQRIVFEGGGSDLVTNDFNPPAGATFVRDLFMRDLPTGTTTLLTVNASGTGSARSRFNNTISEEASISADGRYVAFYSGATNLVADFPSRSQDIFIRDIDGASTIWASAGVSEILTNFSAGHYTLSPQMSSDGNTVVFQARDSLHAQPPVLIAFDRISGTSTLLATNVAYESTRKISANGQFVAYQSGHEVWLADLTTGTQELVCGPNMLAGISTCAAPDVSTDGNRVAFLGASSTNGPWNVYVYQRDTGARSLVSITTNGTLAEAIHDSEPAISPDGKRVAFESACAEIVPGDENASADIFVRDTSSNSTSLLSQTAVPARSGARGLGSVPQAGAISEFGRFIAFTSLNHQLVGEGDNIWQDVFVRDRVYGTNQQIKFPETSGPRLAFAPALSTDGRYIAWYEQPVPQNSGTSLTTNIYWMDRETGLARSIPFGGTTFPSSPPSLSPDGQWLTFAERAQPSGITNIYARKISNPSATNILISVNLPGVPTSQGHCSAPVFSRDGQWVFFESRATDLANNLVGGGVVLQFGQLYARNLQTGKIHWVGSTPTSLFALLGGTRNPTFGTDGRFVVFQGRPLSSASANLFRHDLKTTNGNLQLCSSCQNSSMSADERIVSYEQKDSLGILQVYVRDFLNDQTTLISSNSASGNRNSYSPQVSSDGRYIVFSSSATNLVPDDANNVSDIFVYDRALNSTFLVSRGSDGQPGDGPSTHPMLAPDGRTIVFTSFAGNLATADFNLTRDVFTLRLGGPDTDADGMDDEWELTCFDSLDHDGSLDSDSDGSSDLEEYRAGTNPVNNSSVLRVLSASHAVGDTILITWNSEPGRRYRVQFKRDVTAPIWTDIPGVISATGNTSTTTDTTVAGEPRRFYRVMLEL